MTTMKLPENYKLTKEINLQKNKKLMLFINIVPLLLCIPLIVIGVFISPIEIDFKMMMKNGVALKLIIVSFGTVGYVILHELVHGFFIKRYCGEKAEYGFTGAYAFAGKKTAYFSKNDYRVIALSPVIVWGIVLLILNLFVPTDWFWVIYFIQIINLTGAFGDYYVTYLLHKMSKDVLINDDGVSMRFYEPKN